MRIPIVIFPPLVMALMLCFAQPTYGQQSARFDSVNRYDTTPALVPAAPADVLTRSVFLLQISLTNESASAVTCDVLDKQSTPRAAVKTVSLAANSVAVLVWPFGRRMLNGVNWSCSSGTAVTGSLTYAMP